MCNRYLAPNEGDIERRILATWASQTFPAPALVTGVVVAVSCRPATRSVQSIVIANRKH